MKVTKNWILEEVQAMKARQRKQWKKGESKRKTKQINKYQVLVRLWRKGNPSALLVGMQTSAATVEHSMEFPQKTKNGTFFWPSNSTAGIIPYESQNTNSKESIYPYVHSSTIYNSQVLETA